MFDGNDIDYMRATALQSRINQARQNWIYEDPCIEEAKLWAYSAIEFAIESIVRCDICSIIREEFEEIELQKHLGYPT